MKLIVGAIAGFILGVLATTFAIHFSPTVFRAVVAPVFRSTHPPAMLEDASAPLRFGRPGDGSLAIKKGQMLLIRNRVGGAAIEITDEGDGFATYRWRFRAPNATTDERGTGRVFELYKQSQVSTDHVDVTDLGSDLTIAAGPFAISWSSGGTEGGWLYMDAKRMNASVVSATTFDSVSLHE